MPSAVAPIVLAFPTRLPALRLSENSSELVSSWIQVAVVGDYEDRRYGAFSITPEMLEAMVLNFSSGKFPTPPTEICVDYDHLTTKAATTPGDGKAAGWFKELQTKADGDELWARVEWTAAGAAAVGSKEYKFFSPYFTSNYETNTGEEIGPCLINGAITNRPFLQGMEPLSLAAHDPKSTVITLGSARRIALSAMTDNDKRDRVEMAIRQRFGTWSTDTYGYQSCDTWLNDTIDGQEAVFSKGGLYQIVSYEIESDGRVTFTGEPEGVTRTWSRLSAGGGKELMSKKMFALTAADGKSVQVSEDQLENTELVKSLRALVPAEGSKVLSQTEFTALTGKVETQGAAIEKLTTESAANKDAAEKANKALATAEADKKVDALIAAGKVMPAQRDHYVELALNHGEMFTKLTADMPVIVKLNKQTGSGDEAATDKAAQLDAKAKELRAANPKLSAEQATALALEQDPSLYQG